jgi:hypothetical protein
MRACRYDDIDTRLPVSRALLQDPVNCILVVLCRRKKLEHIIGNPRSMERTAGRPSLDV